MASAVERTRVGNCSAKCRRYRAVEDTKQAAEYDLHSQKRAKRWTGADPGEQRVGHRKIEHKKNRPRRALGAEGDAQFASIPTATLGRGQGCVLLAFSGRRRP